MLKDFEELELFTNLIHLSRMFLFNQEIPFISYSAKDTGFREHSSWELH